MLLVTSRCLADKGVVPLASGPRGPSAITKESCCGVLLASAGPSRRALCHSRAWRGSVDAVRGGSCQVDPGSLWSRVCELGPSGLRCNTTRPASASTRRASFRTSAVCRRARRQRRMDAKSLGTIVGAGISWGAGAARRNCAKRRLGPALESDTKGDSEQAGLQCTSAAASPLGRGCRARL